MFSMNSKYPWVIVQGACLLGLLFLANVFVAEATAQESKSLNIEIDARDLPQKLLYSRLTIPVKASKKPTELALWYPKWVPGSHGPGGPVENVGGMEIHNQQGVRLDWRRSPGEAYRILVEVPPGTTSVEVRLTYITNQPTVTSMGHDSWGAKSIGVISPNTILMVPEYCDIRETMIDGRILFPRQWCAASAMFAQQKDGNDEGVLVPATSIENFVDSPIMCGLNYECVELVDGETHPEIPPHSLHIFSDSSVGSAISSDILDRYRSMVIQTARLTGAHPFDRFDILLGVTDQLPANGLEHSRSTFNVLPPNALASINSLRGWNRLLVPHEYLHAWCGKYRRPAGMISDNFHTPEDTELLWVYEGLTQYLGELVEARSGLMTEAQFRDRILVELRNATFQQGRKWRTLADTGAAAYLLRGRSASWGELRRSQDFYMEGMLFWLEVDAILRQRTNGSRSIDDFCHQFFRVGKNTKHPNPYTRDDIVAILNRLLPYDWDGLILRRIESLQHEFDPSVAGLLGYRFEPENTPYDPPGDTFRGSSGTDMRSSLGTVFSGDGTIASVLRGSVAEEARLRPGMRVVAVGTKRWGLAAIRDAVANAGDGKPIELHILDDEAFRTVQVHYYDGLRSLNLVPDGPNVLEEIVRPRD